MADFFFHLGISPTPSTEKNVEPEEPNNQSTDKTDKTRVVVEKITSPFTKPSAQSTKIEITPTPFGVEKVESSVDKSVRIEVETFKPDAAGVGEREGKETRTNVKEMETTVSTEEATIETKVEKLSSEKSEKAKGKDGATVSVEKIEKTGQKVGGDGEKEEKQNEKPTESVEVEMVKEKVAKKEEQVPAQSSVTKLANDRQSNDEQIDLEGGGAKENGNAEAVIAIEKISPAKGNAVQEQMAANEEKVNEEDAVRIRVEKVADAVAETKEKKADEASEFTVKKVENDEAEKEEEDLESDGKGKSEIAESQEKPKDIQVEVVKERREIDRVPGQITVEKLANDEGENEEKDLENAGNGEAENAAAANKQEESQAKEVIPLQVSVKKVTSDEAKNYEMDQASVDIKVEKMADEGEDYEKNDLEMGEAGKREMKEAGREVMITVQKDENEKPKITAEAKRVQTQEASEEENLGARVEKLPMEASLSKETPLESEKTITVKVEKIQSSTISDEAEDGAQPKVEVTVEKLKAPEPSMKSAVKTGEPTSKRVYQKAKLSSEVPTTERPVESRVKVEKITSEEEDLKNSGSQFKAEVEKVPNQGGRSEGVLGDARRKTENSQDEEQELENEQEQELEAEEETPEERKLALEFEKALKAERNRKQNLKTQSLKPPSTTPPPVTEKPHEATTEEMATKETASGKEAVESENESKRGMSIEELELAELANNVLSDDKEEVKPVPSTETPPAPTTAATTAAEKVLAVKVQKQPKIKVTVTKEQNENLLSEKETAQEEEKLKEELAKELKQEKSEVKAYLYIHQLCNMLFTPNCQIHRTFVI